MTGATTQTLIVATASLTVGLSIASMVGVLSGGLVMVAALASMSVSLGLLVVQTFNT